jgi:hypothetical protein
MKDVSVTIDGGRYKAKNLNDNFADFVESDLKSSNVFLDRDNSAEAMFIAYLRLANRWHNYEKEIDDILSDIEKE